MVRYYRLSHSTDTKVVGSSPYGPLELNAPLNFKSIIKFKNMLPRLAEFRLKGNARITDWTYCMNIDFNVFIVSHKMRTILEQFNLQEHQWADCKIVKKERMWDYNMLLFSSKRNLTRHPVVFIPEMIDWSRSEFYVDERCGLPIKGDEPVIKFDSHHAYISAKEELYKKDCTMDIGFKKLEFDETYLENNRVDMCWPFPLEGYPLISERLRTALLEGGITGMDLMDINDYPTRKEWYK